MRQAESCTPFQITLYCLYCALIIVVPTELFVRYYIIPGEDHGYLQVDSAAFPFFRLKGNFSMPGVTIHSGRREFQVRGRRARAVSFVGDSVTFGTHVGDADSYVEQVQRIQELYDAYNFGVPGYGLPEIRSVVAQLLREGRYDAIVYTFNFNDIHAGMSGMLSLLENENNRFASMDRYDGLVGRLKQFGKDHFKTLFVLRYLGSKFALRKSITEPSAVEPRLYCYRDVLAMSAGDAYEKPNRLWQVMYRDPELVAKLHDYFRQLRTMVELSDCRFFVAVTYDFLLFKDGTDEAYRSIIDYVLRSSGVDLIDTYPLYRQYYKECDFYADPRHLGKMGSRLLAEFVHANLLARLIALRSE